MLSIIPRYAPRLNRLDTKVSVVPTSIESFTMQYLSPLVPPESPSTAFSIESLAVQFLTPAAVPASPSTAFSIESLAIQYLVKA